MKVILEKVRCSYVYIDKTNKHGKYSLQPLIEKGSALEKKFQKAVMEVLTDKFGEAAAKKLGKYKLPLRDGDEERDGDEYQGMSFLNANSAKRPGILNKNKEEADQDDLEEYAYSGAIFNVSVNLYPFESTEGGKPGVAVGLNNVMLVKKAERLDGTVSASKEFEDFEVADEDDDFDDDEL